MSRLIATLIDLSALENGATELVPERSDVVEFLETVAGRLLMNAPDTDFDLQYELPWTKFYRDKNTKYSGSGLGLAIVAQILSMQHLAYGAANREDGMVFYFSIPTVT